MEDSPKYAVTLLAVPPVACRLADEIATVLAGAQLAAASSGLPAVHFATRHALRDGQLSASYCLIATRPGLEFHNAPVEGYGQTLAEAEQHFYTKLRAYELSLYDADPERFADAQIESYQQLEAAA